jgi:Bacterial extracellular solute-binding protein
LADGFAKANPRAEVSVEAEPSKQSILRFVADEADVMVAESKNIRLLDAYVRGLPQPARFAIDPLVLAVPKGNPAGIQRLEDAGQLPPEAVCTPPYMLEARSQDLDDVVVPVNEDSAPDCGPVTVDAVAAGDLAAAAVPGSAVNFVRLLAVGRVRLSLSGGLYAAYEMALANDDNEAAIGFRNFVASRAGRDIITGQGYSP